MKEQYVAPEVKLIGFVASEKIAGSSVKDELSFSGLPGLTLSGKKGAVISKTDIRIPRSQM